MYTVVEKKNYEKLCIAFTWTNNFFSTLIVFYGHSCGKNCGVLCGPRIFVLLTDV